MTDRDGGSDRTPMFSRAEVERGLPARRASTVVFAIEAHTARLVANSRVSRATFVSERGSAQREQAFLQAMAAGRDLPVQPTIHDLERFAPQWAELVPDGVEARAAVAALLAAKYRLIRDRVPRNPRRPRAGHAARGGGRRTAARYGAWSVRRGADPGGPPRLAPGGVRAARRGVAAVLDRLCPGAHGDDRRGNPRGADRRGRDRSRRGRRRPPRARER